MLRRLVAGAHVERVPPSDRAILRRADLVGLSHLDVARDTSLGDLARFLHPGARLLVTQGGHGGLLVTTGDDGPVEVLRYLPTPTEREVDPTGAGDTFLAALLAVFVRPSVAGSPGTSLGASPALRGRCRIARGRGRRPGGCPGPHVGAHPARPRTGPPGGRAEPDGPGRRGGSAPVGAPQPDAGPVESRTWRSTGSRTDDGSTPFVTDEAFHGPAAHLVRALRDRGQRRIDVRGEGHVVEADDARVDGHPPATPAKRPDRADRHQVVVGHDRRRARCQVEQLLGRCLAATDQRLTIGDGQGIRRTAGVGQALRTPARRSGASTFRGGGMR